MVAMNDDRLSSKVAPFGGIKHSGEGREGSLNGLADYIEIGIQAGAVGIKASIVAIAQRRSAPDRNARPSSPLSKENAGFKDGRAVFRR
jgi:hypothetical protein